MVDLNGKFTYTKIAPVYLNNMTSRITIYPNPISTNLSVKLNHPLSANSKLRILDITGRTLINQNIAAAQTLITVDVQRLPAGKYFISVVNNSDIINESFVIAK